MDSIKNCLSLLFFGGVMLAMVFGGELKRDGWLRWNTNWFLRDDPGGEPPSPRDDLVVEDFLQGGHYFEAEDWRDPGVRDEAEATFNHLAEKNGLPANFRLRPWREAMKRNSRYDLRRQVQLLVEIDACLARAEQSGGRFGTFATLALLGTATAVGAASETPFETARTTSAIGSTALPGLKGFWTEQTAKNELRILAGWVSLPETYGADLDPTHPITTFLKSYKN